MSGSGTQGQPTIAERASFRRRGRAHGRRRRPAQGHGLRHSGRPAGGCRPLHRLRSLGRLWPAGLVPRPQREFDHDAGHPDGRRTRHCVVPDGDPAKLLTATATLTALVGALLLAGQAAAARLRRQLHLRAGADGLQGRDRARDPAGPGARSSSGCTSRSSPSSPTCSSLVPSPPRDLPADAGRRGGHAGRVLVGMERLKPHSPAPLVVVGGGHRRLVAASVWAHGGSRPSGHIPQGLPSLILPDPTLVQALLAGRHRHRADELHRDDRRGPRLRAPATTRPSTPIANWSRRERPTSPARCSGRCRPAAGRRRRASCAPPAAGPGGLARHRRGRPGHDAAAGADARASAARDARGGRHRLLGSA